MSHWSRTKIGLELTGVLILYSVSIGIITWLNIYRYICYLCIIITLIRYESHGKEFVIKSLKIFFLLMLYITTSLVLLTQIHVGICAVSTHEIFYQFLLSSPSLLRIKWRQFICKLRIATGQLVMHAQYHSQSFIMLQF